jgi:hypothetical protein
MLVDASYESRQLRVPRRALVRAGLQPWPGAGADKETHEAEGGLGVVAGAAGVLSSDESSGQVSEMEVDEVAQGTVGEEPLEWMDFQPVLTEWTCDWSGRCELTSWAGHGAQFNGGWCMCNQKGKSAQVRSVQGLHNSL